MQYFIDTVVVDEQSYWYAFAAELIKHGVRTWQSGTRVSILSPHTLEGLFKQRSRWFVGTWNLVWDTSPVTRLFTGIRLVSWLCAIVAGPVSAALWHHSGGVPIPMLLRVAPPLAGVIYAGTYFYGAFNVDRKAWALFALLLPVYAVFEALSPFYAVLFSDREFTVIQK